MAQVKFYATSAESYANIASKDAGGIYFVEGGELYKGSSRFGANKVWTSKPEENAGVISGDMYIKDGVAEVFNGTSWVGITDANKWTASTYGGTGSYIQSISQAADGTVTATAVSFPTLATGDAAGQVKLGTTNVSVNGWGTLVASVGANASAIASVSEALGSLSTTVASVSSRVTDIESIVSTANGGSVSASSGTFTNLTVTDTATFSVTNVVASSLTVNGDTINEIAQAEISAVTANTIVANGTSLPTQSAVASYVTTAVSNLAGAMHFRGIATITKSGESITVSNFVETFTPAAGDVVVDTAENLEAVYTGSNWELLGSNAVYALDAYAPGSESVTAGTTTLGGAVHAIAASVDALTTSFGNLGTAASKNYADSLASTGTSLPTESAVATYVASVVSNLDATVSSSAKGIQVSVTETDGVLTAASVAVTLQSSISSANTNDEIPSAKAVYDALCWLDASGTPIA